MGEAEGIVRGKWEQVPLLHWRRLTGARMRRLVWDSWSIAGEYDGKYEYATMEQCAEIVLRETYDVSL